ncbi:class I SAM-dependent methyltransferase family protein [Candidatus Woesearchaeota archaeon]|nr:class I SAM-dependent methyltransferase family protein [Candidatus Woesearchaeota archaeon]
MKATLKQALEGKLPVKCLQQPRRAFDIIGDIAIIEIPEELRKKEKQIAAAVPILQKTIKAVYRKAGGHEGEFRLQKLKHLWGERRTETTHKENNTLLRLDIAKAYFSPRQATERKRVFLQVKKPETVLVMFSGVGPFTLEIAKNTPAKAVYGIELNRIAHKSAIENAKLNKVEDKTWLFCGDVRKIVPKLRQKFDRIIMPLPKGAESFLDVAFAAAKKGATIHFYDFEKEEDIPHKAAEKVRKAASAANKKIRVLDVAKCGQLAARAYRVCVDFKVVG